MRRIHLRILLPFIWVLCAQCQITTTWASSRFIGYYVAPDSTQPLLAGNSWVTSGTLAGDCNNGGRCAMATDCSNGTLFYDNSATVSCTGAYKCVEMTIFAGFPNVLPSAYNFACRMGWNAHTVYRELAATTTSSSSVASSTITTGPIAPPSTGASSTSTAASVPTPTPEPSSNAWIAGAVIGPIVGVALIGVVLFWWRRRSSRGHNGGPGYVHELGPQEYMSGQQPLVEKYTHKRQPVELEHPQQHSELPTRHPPSELSGSHH